MFEFPTIYQILNVLASCTNVNIRFGDDIFFYLIQDNKHVKEILGTVNELETSPIMSIIKDFQVQHIEIGKDICILSFEAITLEMFLSYAQNVCITYHTEVFSSSEHAKKYNEIYQANLVETYDHFTENKNYKYIKNYILVSLEIVNNNTICAKFMSQNDAISYLYE